MVKMFTDLLKVTQVPQIDGSVTGFIHVLFS